MEFITRYLLLSQFPYMKIANDCIPSNAQQLILAYIDIKYLSNYNLKGCFSTHLLYLYSIMEKLLTGVVPLEYQSINDRISRIRKEAASLNRLNKQRLTLQPSQQKFERTLDLTRVQRQGNYKLKAQSSTLRLDFNSSMQTIASMLSPRKYGISKRTQYRYQTQDDKKSQQQNRGEGKQTKNRVPGKIKKNTNNLLYALQETTNGLKINYKNVV